MKNKELLSPVGNMESLYQAVHNGADAVYLGLKSFGARHFAKNFDNDEVIEAIKFCHLYGVKIYVTMNTLIKDSEVNDFIESVKFLHKNGVDAIIMQDFGMICLVRNMFPNLEIHASTQANNSSLDTIRLFHNLGVKRVVLSRELSIDDINKIDVDIEIEAFIHGALCISYSGNCLMSSMIGKRSGNRGECTGCCRLPYDLYENDKKIVSKEYLLSTKELNTSNYVNELLNSKIKSFKIEGRMKSPEYVGFITKYYRRLLDGIPMDKEEALNNLKTLFNRKFTEGYIFNANNITNKFSPNHIGLEIGKVVDIKNNRIKIKLSKPLNQEDGIRFLESGKGLICNYLYDSKDRFINSSNDFVYIDNKIDLKTYDIVYKTFNQELVTNLRKYEVKKLPIDMKLIAKINEPLKLIIKSEFFLVSMESSIVEIAKTNPLSKERIEMQLQKLGNTPFYCKNIKIDMDNNIFISIKELNEIRRNLISQLIEKRKKYVKDNYCYNEVKFQKLNNISINNNIFTASIHNEEQLIKCLDLGFSRIYVRDELLYKKYKDNSKIYYFKPRNLFNDYNNIRSLVSEYSIFLKDGDLVGNYFLNVYNSYTAYYLMMNNLYNFNLSVELTDEEIINLMSSFKKNFGFSFTPEILVYGKVENMYIKGNILNIDNSLYKYKLKDQRNRIFDVYLDSCLNTIILDYKNMDRNSKYPFGCQLRFDFYDESPSMIERIVKKY